MCRIRGVSSPDLRPGIEMILKYLGPPADYPLSSGPFALQVGSSYDVAEILEMPDHLMCRAPGSKKWPVPGDPMFGWHPEFFENPVLPIEIVSCGYLERRWSGYWGVVLNEPEDVRRIRDYQATYHENIDPPDFPTPLSFESWYAQIPTLPERVARVVYELELMPGALPEVVVEDRVRAPMESCKPFVVVAYESNLMINHLMSKTDAEARVNRFLECLDIRTSPIEEVNMTFWIRHPYRFDLRFHTGS